MAAAWTANEARYMEVETRINTWRNAGFATPSGVETFYDSPTPADQENAVATMIHAAWR